MSIGKINCSPPRSFLKFRIPWNNRRNAHFKFGFGCVCMDFPHLNENNLLSLLWIWRIQQIMGIFAIFPEILPSYNLLKYILIILILSEKDESLVSKLITWIQEMSIIPHEISWWDISVVQVVQVIQLIQVMQGRLAHLWPDFRVILLIWQRIQITYLKQNFWLAANDSTEEGEGQKYFCYLP